MPDTPLPTAPRVAGDLRTAVTDADRERVAALLSTAFADDALSLDEFEQRVASVYRATNRRELDALVADLAPARRAQAAANAATTSDPVPTRDRRFAVLANLSHHSMAVVPQRLDVLSILGNVELDLRDATFGADGTELCLRAVLGNITITLPAGTIVEQRASSILASIECQPSPHRAGRSRAPIVRLTGHAALASVEIRFAERGATGAPSRDRPPRPDRLPRVP